MTPIKWASGFWLILQNPWRHYTHEHEITNETFNDTSAKRQTRRQFIDTATSAGRNIDER